MIEYFFTKEDKDEGKIGIGKLPDELHELISNLSNEYYELIPDKNKSTYHTWYKDMPEGIKEKVKKVQEHVFWNDFCEIDAKNCVYRNVGEMDELYYSNPPNNLKNINLYGAVGNYDIHRDSIFHFNGIKMYRVLIGLTDKNESVKTYFNKFGEGKKINKNDYVVFDFDNTTHQVIKENEKKAPRILLKLHFIVSNNSKYDIDRIKNVYILFERITRYIMDTGTNPTTYYEFFLGLMCQYYCTKYMGLYVILYILLLYVFVKDVLKLNKNRCIYVFGLLVISYLLIVFFYYMRYKLFLIR
jgi:hypothetical protein